MQKISVKTIYLILVISIGLVGLGVGSTFAMFTASSKIDNPISFTAGIFGESDVIETVEVTVPAGETKATNLHVTNSTNSNLNYVMWYIDEGLDIELGSKRTDSGTYQTTIDAGEEHKYEVSIRNNSSSSVTVVIGVSSGTGSVTLSSDMKMVPQSELKLKPTLASVITNLYNNSTKTAVPNNSITYQYDTTNNLMKDTAGNIRYYGASPNNYVYFNCDSYPSTNCELWRIIGVFDGKIKLIRNKTIDLYSWDNKNKSTGAETAYGKNDWTTARLMKLLNPSTYYTTDANDNGKGQSLYWNATSGACYSGQNNATISCNFTSTGIKDTTRNMIAETTWNLVGWNTSDIYSNVMYEKERGTTTVSNPSDGITRATTWTGKIALPYPSDYGYATDLSKCSQTLFNYNSGTDSYACRSNDWMYSIITNSGINDGWLLTPYSGYAYMAFGVHSSGYVNSNNAVYHAYGVAPVLYLGSDQDIVAWDGDGSQSNPYQLAA